MSRSVPGVVRDPASFHPRTVCTWRNGDDIECVEVAPIVPSQDQCLGAVTYKTESLRPESQLSDAEALVLAAATASMAPSLQT